MTWLERAFNKAVGQLRASERIPRPRNIEEAKKFMYHEDSGFRQSRSFEAGLTILGALVLQDPSYLEGIPSLKEHKEFIKDLCTVAMWKESPQQHIRLSIDVTSRSSYYEEIRNAQR